MLYGLSIAQLSAQKVQEDNTPIPTQYHKEFQES